MPKPRAKAYSFWALTFQLCDSAKPGTTLPEQVDIERCFQDRLEASRYVFQYERGANTGRLHIQAHLELKQPITGSALRDKIRFSGGMRSYYHSGCLNTSPVHDVEASFAYAEKDENVVRGPYRFPTHLYVGQDLIGSANFPTPLPWQKQALDWLEHVPHEREVHVLYDEAGCNGKSKLTKTLCYHKKAIKVPFGLSVQQGIAAIISQPASRTYLVDIPRSNIDDRLIWETVEGLKNGHLLSSWRGAWKEKFFDAPHVLVFCNKLPDLSHLSMDHWRLWKVTSAGELEPMEKYAVLKNQQRLKRVDAQEKSRRKIDFVR